MQFLRDHRTALLADEPGLGKTAQLVRASEGSTLVVAPASVLAGNAWSDDIERFADQPERFTTVPYTSLNMRRGRQVVRDRVRPEFDQTWDTLVLDEAHMVKGRRTSWTLAVQKLAAKAGKVYMASGTPIPNWPHELFVLLQIMWPEEAKPKGRLGSYWRWVDAWFRTVPNRFNPQARDILGLKNCDNTCALRPAWDPCEHYYGFTDANMGDRFLQRKRDEVLTDLPPMTKQVLQCPMSDTQWRIYSEFRRQWLADLPDGKQVVTWTPGARTVAMDKVCTAPALAGEVDWNAPVAKLAAKLKAGSSKLQRLEELLAGRARPTFVVAHYRDSARAAMAVAQSLGARTEIVRGGTRADQISATVRRFQAGETDVLVGTIDAISEGVTLTAADMIVMLEHSYRPSRNEQVSRRIHRIGQTRPCTLVDLVSGGPKNQRTLDTMKRALLAGKTDQQARVLTAANWVEAGL